MSKYTPDQIALLSYLKSENDKLEARFGDGVRPIIEDIDFHAESGLFSIADFEHYELVNEVFEATRSVYGYKPSWPKLKEMTNEALRKELEAIHNSFNNE